MRYAQRIRKTVGVTLLCMALYSSAQAEETLSNYTYTKPIIADISQDIIEIHAQFDGEQVLLYGARNAPGDIIAVVTGPYAKAKLSRKDKIVGIWMQVERAKFKNIPLYFALASTRNVEKILPPETLDQLGISYPHMGGNQNPVMVQALTEKLTDRGWLNLDAVPIQYFGETLFLARLNFPSSLPRGNYTVDVFLVDRGDIIAVQSIPLSAVKTGVDFWLYDTARHHAWWYGLGAALLSLTGGWLGNRLVRRR